VLQLQSQLHQPALQGKAFKAHPLALALIRQPSSSQQAPAQPRLLQAHAACQAQEALAQPGACFWVEVVCDDLPLARLDPQLCKLQQLLRCCWLLQALLCSPAGKGAMS
jgi:hypothetical protein